jgi:superfamily I DNA and/or RNA helicase/very-short-patch-repair endonuclease
MESNLIFQNNILEILKRSQRPLSTREIAARLRLAHKRLPDYKIGTYLRKLQRTGDVIFSHGRWKLRAPVPGFSSGSASSDIDGPRVSAIASHILKKSHVLSAQDNFNDATFISASEESQSRTVSSPWDIFRKLVAYYRHCIRNEEGANASAYHNQLGTTFLYLRQFGYWQPRPGFSWRITLPLGPHLSSFLKSLPASIDDQALVLGYPLQAHYIRKEVEPDIAVIRPVFFYQVEANVSRNALEIIARNPRPEINLSWLDYSFGRNVDRQKTFLSACGFLNSNRSGDEFPSFERGENIPGLENFVAALTAFLPDRIKEPLEITSITDEPLSEPFETGIYNRVVLMVAKRTRFTATLLKELAVIEKSSDDELNKTALRYIFLQQGTGAGDNSELVHEKIVADTMLLNAEQRRAVASLLERNITVITGPPGTGKSQVVSSVIANARLKNQTVLFASRNHKAIDAVIDRLRDKNGRLLLVRTNSKDDPNLNYSFQHAIKELLAEQYEEEIRVKYERVKEDLFSLLEYRGRKAFYAYEAAKIKEILGELEEQLADIIPKLPLQTIEFMEKNSALFPIQAVQFFINEVYRCLNSPVQEPLLARVIQILKAILNLRWYTKCRVAFKKIPELPELPLLPTRYAFKNFQKNISVIENLKKYCELRNKCRPLEEKAAELIPQEELTAEIKDVSRRIAEIVPDAISLDLDSRRGLKPEDNREELTGLHAAIKAMRTGLEEGHINRETIRVLKERIPRILDAFPCWAVTNLSVGSRLPLVAGMFDLAIIDEASQSDIPSAIPILYRARRAGVVGDPFQLSHTSKLSTARDTLLRRNAGLKRIEDARFAYTESSLYDLFASTNNVEPVFLSETYRSVEPIAEYSSFTFYSGRLRVATNPSRINVPPGMRPGIHWTELTGTIQSAGGSGCYCPEEVEEVVRLIKNMLIANNFKGTVGVVTPFRQQANRLQDALFEDSELFELIQRTNLHVDTAHGFQGDERDVIIFSLCAGPDMPAGSRAFLRETGNLFNVAVSRARVVVHVIGNRSWAINCGIKHIENLAKEQKKCVSYQHKGPWYPHESPWEKILYDALVGAGLNPIPQLPVSSRRLDLALIRKEPSLKIDIEVDGDCHRNPDGSRKIDDIWRDIQLQGLGWKIMRFWVYQLREDLDGCVQKIINTWSSE